MILAEGGAPKYSLRKSASLNKDGVASDWPASDESSFNADDPNFIYPYGMSWFPGYAVNLETGERMNIVFGEDSWLSADNGRDMLFNPTSSGFDLPSLEPLFGGKHYVYIMGSGDFIKITGGDTLAYSFGAYDAGRAHVEALAGLPDDYDHPLYEIYGSLIYASSQYVGIPLAMPNQEWLSNEVKLRFNVIRPYQRYYTGKETPESLGDGINNHYPVFRFSTEGVATTYYNAEKAESDLDQINVVPNPYYGFGVDNGYEQNALDNMVKITNLPEKCIVTIYSVSGTMIRQYTKDDPITSIDWDLKNHAGIPIAGGVYMIHIKDQTLDSNNEKIIKWFGSLRIEDFNEF